MKKVTVELGSRSYPVLIGEGLLEQQSAMAPFTGVGQVLVVTNERVGPLYLEKTRAILPEERTHALVLPDGEVHKTVATWNLILDELVRIRANRDAVIVGLGGGVIGDMAGFAAASYMRGIEFVQVPTTLLAQVDASVGGKTGVNHPRGKNLIGAFHQPRAVIIDVATMSTLPDREYRAGVAEVIKYGLIRDAGFFEWLESSADDIAGRTPAAVQHMVEISVRNKAEVVAADEREAGSRALLNLGHSFGHALETLTGYERFLHGEAVAIGMLVATRLSEMRGLIRAGAADRLATLLSRFELPVNVPGDIAPGEIYASLSLDKKTLGGQLRLILLDDMGSARVDDSSTMAEILGAIEQCSG